ncbi:MAG: FIST C-terminal domain-containing protein [Chitinophagales bacterium]
MHTQQKKWTLQDGWKHLTNTSNFVSFEEKENLVFVFGNRFQLADPLRFDEIRTFYPNSHIIIASTAGEIVEESVIDDSIVITAVYFEHTDFEVVTAHIEVGEDSYEVGKKMALSWNHEELKQVFILSDGQLVNGSELVKGLNEYLPEKVVVTGGLAGDGPRFEKTLVGYNAAPNSGNIVGVGFYGDKLTIGYGSIGGWDPFGPERIITKSKENVLYELDGKSALQLYKRYLGEKAAGLPGTALLYPLSIRITNKDKPLVRTILSIDEETQSMTFAGDVPEGASARLMKANFDKLIDGAYNAANASIVSFNDIQPELAILISCVGRKLLLGPRIDEEVESVAEAIGHTTCITGFYSYGEIAPFSGALNCELHNQTMTITLLSEL